MTAMNQTWVICSEFSELRVVLEIVPHGGRHHENLASGPRPHDVVAVRQRSFGQAMPLIGLRVECSALTVVALALVCGQMTTPRWSWSETL